VRLMDSESEALGQKIATKTDLELRHFDWSHFQIVCSRDYVP
jgi:hypothetical protein